MKGVSVIASVKVNNLAELIAELQILSNSVLHTVNNNDVTIDDGAVVLRLEVQTLTDGSEVYNLAIQEVSPVTGHIVNRP
jgi:hypothetical protein